MFERMPGPPRPTGIQRLWLLELGLDRPMLARLAPESRQKPVRSFRTDASNDAAAAKEHNRAAQPNRAAEHDSAAEQNRAAEQNHAAATAAFAALRPGNHQPGATPASAAQSESTHATPTAATVAVVNNTSSIASAKTGPTPDDTTKAVSFKSVPADWAALEARIQSCEICELHTGRHRAVAGAGAVEAVDWFVVGEAPGERDDRVGQPFQGKAGELLHAMLRAAGIDPLQAVFYTNLVKCRPRSNRLPSVDEIAACRPHLHNQIALLRPRGILALGRLAAHALLAAEKSDSRSFEALRGRVHEFQLPDAGTIPLVVTYHPASLLSRPRHKAASWQDLNLARTLS